MDICVGGWRREKSQRKDFSKCLSANRWHDNSAGTGIAWRTTCNQWMGTERIVARTACLCTLPALQEEKKRKRKEEEEERKALQSAWGSSFRVLLHYTTHPLILKSVNIADPNGYRKHPYLNQRVLF